MPTVLNYLLEISAISVFEIIKCEENVGFSRHRNVLRNLTPSNIIPVAITNILRIRYDGQYNV